MEAAEYAQPAGLRRLGAPRVVDALEYAAARLPDIQALRRALRTGGGAEEATGPEVSVLSAINDFFQLHSGLI